MFEKQSCYLTAQIDSCPKFGEKSLNVKHKQKKPFESCFCKNFEFSSFQFFCLWCLFDIAETDAYDGI